jgi:glycosyltransferase involved in cell wall biosynthesis
MLADDLASAIASRDADALDELALRYDQMAPDVDAASAISSLERREGSLVGYLGKLIPQKGVERMLEALVGQPDIHGVVVGFGTYREWLEALVDALDRGDLDAYDWLRTASQMKLELDAPEVVAGHGLRSRLSFTGRLDHRYAPGVLSALDVLIVPSTLAEAFGMVAAEGAAAGAFPLVSRHSGLAEVAEALEGEAGRPGLFSFEPGDGATARMGAGLQALLAIDGVERDELRAAISGYVAREWSWEATARRIFEAAGSDF